MATTSPMIGKRTLISGMEVSDRTVRTIAFVEAFAEGLVSGEWLEVLFEASATFAVALVVP
jgi:hypothetical protein